MIIFTGTKVEIENECDILGLLRGCPDIGDGTNKHMFLGCGRPKKGQYFLRPSGNREVFNLEIAENDHVRYNYPIIHPKLGELFKSKLMISQKGGNYVRTRNGS